MRYIISFVLMIFSVNAHAVWSSAGSFKVETSDKITTSSGVVSNIKSQCFSAAASLQYPYKCYVAEPTYNSSGYYSGNGSLLYLSKGSVTFDDNSTIYNYVYTDEECDSSYGGETKTYTFPSSYNAGDSVSAGSCSITPVGVSACFQDGDTVTCSADWVGSSTGQVNTLDIGSGGDSDVVEETLPEYLTETSDVSSCGGSSISMGGASYCVNTTEINVTDLSGTPIGGSGGSADPDGDGINDGDTDGDGNTDSDGDGVLDGDTDGDGTCDTNCTPVVMPTGYTTEKNLETVINEFYSKIETAPVLNMMPNLPDGGSSSCQAYSLSIGWIINKTYSIDYCELFESSGLATLIYAMSMFGWCFSAYRVLMGA